MLNLGVSSSASQPNQKRFSRFVTGDLLFADYQAKFRNKLFLDRNLRCVLAYHEQRIESAQAASLVSAGPSTTPPSFGELSREATSWNPRRAGEVDGAIPPGSRWVSSLTRPTGLAMASKSRSALSNLAGNGRSTRRSIRNVLDRVYEDGEAEMVFDLSNIRKKLNFKTNCLDDSERPAKRQKRDSIKCICHLTIWDNRDGFALVPLTTKSTYCRVASTETTADGYFVDIEMDNPFTIRAEELKVPIDTRQGSVSRSELEVIDKYFLEVKIIPCRSDSQWPPIPILGKSDGDHFARDIRRTGSEELQGAVVARYTHLPQAPEADVPLSVFFLHEGRTYRTKYGLQVDSFWRKSTGRTNSLKTERSGLDLDSFLRDTPNGVNGVGAKHLNTKRKEPDTSKPVEESQPEVCYSFSSTISTQQAAEEFRSATVKGYQCPLCSKGSVKLNHLLFHLSTLHPKYSFQLQKPRRHPRNNDWADVQIKVDVAPTVRTREDAKHIDWQAPDKPFDLAAYVDGDHSWANPPKREPPVPSRYTSNRPTTGFPRASEVPNFRKPMRKKYPAVKLEVKYNDLEQHVSTSISHRPVSPSEDPRSETDDEIDSEWQIQMHMERLERTARRKGWSQYECELRRRWDRHRMEEQLEHSRYLSNCLVRFVRKHRLWLKTGSDELIVVFFDFLEQLKDRKVIDDDVVSDVNEVIFGDSMLSSRAAGKRPARDTNGHILPSEQGPSETRSRNPATAELRNSPTIDETPEPVTSEMSQLHLRPGEQLDSQSQSKCGHCSIPIRGMQRHAMWCADPNCETPRTAYHKECVLHPFRTPLVNGQERGKGRGKGKGKGKEKEKEAPPTAAATDGDRVSDPPRRDVRSMDLAFQQEESVIRKWACKACVARHMADAQRREQERQREREMVNAAARAAINAAIG